MSGKAGLRQGGRLSLEGLSLASACRARRGRRFAAAWLFVSLRTANLCMLYAQSHPPAAPRPGPAPRTLTVASLQPFASPPKGGSVSEAAGPPLDLHAFVGRQVQKERSSAAGKEPRLVSGVVQRCE